MKLIRTLAMLALCAASSAYAQGVANITKFTSNDTLTASFATGGKTVTVSASGGVFWTAGATFGGASDFRSAAGFGSLATQNGTITDYLLASTAASTYQESITFGTGVEASLSNDIGSAGAPVLFNGAGGTPSSMNGSNITYLNGSNISSGTINTARLDVASQAEAEAGTATDKAMTAERTAQAIAALAGGGHSDVQVFTTSGTWTKPAGAVYVDYILIGGGTGGSSGTRAANGGAATGGAGGGPGKYVHVQGMAAGIFGATETVTVGIGGAGAPAVTTNDTTGVAGTTGTDSVFGSWKAKGGKVTTTYSTGSTADASSCMFPFYTQFSSMPVPSGAGASAAASATALTYPLPTGGGGGATLATSGFQSNGGTGGGYNVGVMTTFIYSGPTSAAGGIAGVGSATGAATDGGDGGCVFLLCGTGGGGGGCNRTAAAGGVSAAGGNGGDGGLYGGGGGGGSGSENGFNSGAGGKGGDGIVIIITHF